MPARRRLGARACESGYGSSWVIAAVIVRLPMVSRPVAVPVPAKLVIKGAPGITWTTRLRKDAAPYELLRPVPGGGDGPA